ncbi:MULTISPECIES: hypothetical protein [unclassified Streptomyces]|nr:hypothetical protein [Streptomyces sp. NBC_00047]MCX5610917.1 hypothetical protein [Streptomyces sp. NBC_00047]
MSGRNRMAGTVVTVALPGGGDLQDDVRQLAVLSDALQTYLEGP